MTIESLVARLRNSEAVTIILGAGASVSGGMPTAAKLIEQINIEFGAVMAALPEDERRDYGKVMGALSRGERRKLLQPLLNGSRVNCGHLALAQLIQMHPQIKRVMTFNFDLLLQRATALLGTHLPVYDLAAAPFPDLGALAEPAIFHLHGQSYGLALLNSEKETAEHKERLSPLLLHSLRNHLTIVIGYSGAADDALRVMESAFNSEYPLFWLGYDATPPHHLNTLLSKEHAIYVGSCDFDETIIRIAEALGCWPPELLTNTPQHILRLLDDVAAYPEMGGFGADPIAGARRELEHAASQWSSGGRPLKTQSKASAVSGLADQRRNLTADERHHLGWLYIQKGHELASQAKQLNGLARRLQFDMAFAAFSDAVDINPRNSDALNEWGITLLHEARIATGAKRRSLFAEAEKKFAAAFNISADDHEVLYNWGVALVDEAQELSGEPMESKLAAAADKFSETIRIAPSFEYAYVNWGRALTDQAFLKTGNERFAKLEQAHQKFDKALQLNERNAEANFHKGLSLYRQGCADPSNLDENALRSASDYFQRTTELDPANHDAFLNWGSALAKLAPHSPMPKNTYSEACRKFEKCVALDANSYMAFDNWARTLFAEGMSLKFAERDAKVAEAADKWRLALAIKPDLYFALRNLGLTMMHEAQNASEDDKRKLLVEAENLFRRSKTISGGASVNLALILVRLDKTGEALSELEACEDETTDKKSLLAEINYYERYMQTLIKEPRYINIKARLARE